MLPPHHHPTVISTRQIHKQFWFKIVYESFFELQMRQKIVFKIIYSTKPSPVTWYFTSTQIFVQFYSATKKFKVTNRRIEYYYNWKLYNLRAQWYKLFFYHLNLSFLFQDEFWWSRRMQCVSGWSCSPCIFTLWAYLLFSLCQG